MYSRFVTNSRLSCMYLLECFRSSSKDSEASMLEGPKFNSQSQKGVGRV